MMVLKWARHSDFPDARPPERAHPTDAGMDVFAAQNYILYNDDIYEIRTGICLEITKGNLTHVLLVWDKSSLAKKGIITVGGVIDEDYRGEIIILAASPFDTRYINKHDKIAQILIQSVEIPIIDEKPSILSNTERGSSGFGSTGR